MAVIVSLNEDNNNNNSDVYSDNFGAFLRDASGPNNPTRARPTPSPYTRTPPPPPPPPASISQHASRPASSFSSISRPASSTRKRAGFMMADILSERCPKRSVRSPELGHVSSGGQAISAFTTSTAASLRKGTQRYHSRTSIEVYTTMYTTVYCIQ